MNRDIYYKRKEILDFPVAPVVKNPPANAGDMRDVGLIPGKNPWRGLATHSSILAWRIPWTEEPVGFSP